MGKAEVHTIEHILKVSMLIYNRLGSGFPAEWVTTNLTVAQLRVLLLLQANGQSRMSDIATEMSVTMPTATGIMDKLVNKGLAVRDTDPKDRRLVICRLSEGGRRQIGKLLLASRFKMQELLEELNITQLQEVSKMVDMLLKASRKVKEQTKSS